MTDQAYVVVAPRGVVERFAANCDRAGVRFWSRPVHAAPSSADGHPREDDALTMTQLLARIPHVAAVLDVSENTVKRLIRSGELPAVKVAGATAVRCADLEAYVEQLATTSTSSSA